MGHFIRFLTNANTFFHSNPAVIAARSPICLKNNGTIFPIYVHLGFLMTPSSYIGDFTFHLGISNRDS